MRTALRVAIAVLAAIWVGAVAFLPVVAAIAFHVLPGVQVAGLLVRNVLGALHTEGLVVGSLLLLLLLAAVPAQAYGRRLIGPVLCAATMLLLTAFSQRGIVPRMEADRLAVGGDMSAAPVGDARRIEFDRLHHASEEVEEGVLAAGLVMVALLARSPKTFSRQTLAGL